MSEYDIVHDREMLEIKESTKNQMNICSTNEVCNVYRQALRLAMMNDESQQTKCDRCEKTLSDDQDGQWSGSKRTGPQPNQHIEIVEIIRYLDNSIMEPRLVLSTNFPN